MILVLSFLIEGALWKTCKFSFIGSILTLVVKNNFETTNFAQIFMDCYIWYVYLYWHWAHRNFRIWEMICMSQALMKNISKGHSIDRVRIHQLDHMCTLTLGNKYEQLHVSYNIFTSQIWSIFHKMYSMHL